MFVDVSRRIRDDAYSSDDHVKINHVGAALPKEKIAPIIAAGHTPLVALQRRIAQLHSSAH